MVPLPSGYHHVRLNKDGVPGMVTGAGTAKAAVSGDHVIDRDLAFEIDARQIPQNWPTGYVPLRKGTPYEPPVASRLHGQFYALKPELVGWAFRLTQNALRRDSETLRKFRACFSGFPNALKPPFVTRGDTMSSSTFWHGSKMDEWANAGTRYYSGGKGNYMIAGMEDSGTLPALTFLNQAGPVDLQRVLILRTVSNYDREPPGTTVADSLNEMEPGNYSAYLPALEAAPSIGGKVVRDIVERWADRESNIPHLP